MCTITIMTQVRPIEVPETEVQEHSCISPKVRKTLDLVFEMGKWTMIMPWRWDKQSGTLNLVEPTKYLHRWRALVYFHVACRIFLPIYVFGSVLFVNVPLYEIFLVSWNIGIQMMTTVTLILLLQPSKEAEARGMANSVIRFNGFLLHSGDFTKKAILSHDTEYILSMLVTAASIFAIMIGPAAGLLLSTGTLELAWLLKYFEFPTFYFFVSLFISYFYAMDIVVVLTVGVMVIVYCDAMSGWLGELKWRSSCEAEAEENRNQRLQVIYRAHQVLNRVVQEFTDDLIPIYITLVLMVSVTVLYSLFGLYEVLNYFVLINCAIIASVCIIMIKCVCSMCGKFTINSLAYKESFHDVIEKAEVDTYFFESLQPITFRIGAYKEINNALFQPIVTNVVVNWVITLLLSLERPFPRSTAQVQYNEF